MLRLAFVLIFFMGASGKVINTECPWDHYYSHGTSRCMPCANVCPHTQYREWCKSTCKPYMERVFQTGNDITTKSALETGNNVTTKSAFQTGNDVTSYDGEVHKEAEYHISLTVVLPIILSSVGVGCLVLAALCLKKKCTRTKSGLPSEVESVHTPEDRIEMLETVLQPRDNDAPAKDQPPPTSPSTRPTSASRGPTSPAEDQPPPAEDDLLLADDDPNTGTGGTADVNPSFVVYNATHDHKTLANKSDRDGKKKDQQTGNSELFHAFYQPA